MLLKIIATSLLSVTDNTSVYIGAWEHPKTKNRHYLRLQGHEHVFAYAPTRSGKEIRMVIPTLLSYSGSMVIADMKGENWHCSAGFGKIAGHVVMQFDPTNSDNTSACFNPLWEVRKGLHEIRDCQNVCLTR